MTEVVHGQMNISLCICSRWRVGIFSLTVFNDSRDYETVGHINEVG